MNIYTRPTTHANYTKEEVREYAFQRKIVELYEIKQLFENKKVKEGEMSPEELEDYREPLAITRETVITIELSTGGDADGFKLTFDKDNQLVSGIYYWADWGEYEEVRLSDEEMQLVDNLYAISDTMESL